MVHGGGGIKRENCDDAENVMRQKTVNDREMEVGNSGVDSKGEKENVHQKP